MMSAMIDARSVPKTVTPANCQNVMPRVKPMRSASSSPGVTRMLPEEISRKIKTEARRTRIEIPAAVEMPLKSLSPARLPPRPGFMLALRSEMVGACVGGASGASSTFASAEWST